MLCCLHISACHPYTFISRTHKWLTRTINSEVAYEVSVYIMLKTFYGHIESAVSWMVDDTFFKSLYWLVQGLFFKVRDFCTLRFIASHDLNLFIRFDGFNISIRQMDTFLKGGGKQGDSVSPPPIAHTVIRKNVWSYETNLDFLSLSIIIIIYDFYSLIDQSKV